MKIKITLTLPADNEIQFFDACKGAIDVLDRLAEEALREGACEQMIGAHIVRAKNDDAEEIGTVTVTR
jgi:hypothetical protein